MTELIEYLRTVGGLDFALVFSVALGVQSIKRNTQDLNWRDSYYMLVGMALSAIMAVLANYGGDAAWSAIAYDAIMYALTSSGVYSYGKQIPILNRFFVSNKGEL